MELDQPIVLLINDNVDVSAGLRVILELEGYAVEIASDGREGLRRLHEGLRPRVILLDLIMPVMSGQEFRQEQAQHPELSQIPVILLSGVAEVADIAHELHAAGHVRLPAELDQLLDSVRQYCAEKG
jgi:CheY-like chemotaxis protein